MKPQVINIPVAFPPDPQSESELLTWASRMRGELTNAFLKLNQQVTTRLDRFYAPIHATASRDAMERPQAGNLIYNESLLQYEYYDGTTWRALAGGPSVATPQLAHYHFANHNAGFVLRGRDNGGLYRLLIDDSDPDLPVIGVEPEGSAAYGDVLFPTATVGPVLYGIFRGTQYRFVINDPGGVGFLGIEVASTISGQDYEFQSPGVSWTNRGRTNRRRYEWLVDDSAGSDIANAVIAIEKFA